MAASDSDHGKEMTGDEYLGRLIEVFKTALPNKMRASHLVWLIDIKEVIDKRDAIVQKENDGNIDGAVKELLDAIRESNQPGRWQMFIDALRAVEDTGVLEILLEERDLLASKSEGGTRLNDDDNRKLIHLFSTTILKRLSLKPLLPTMLGQGLIVESDVSRLSAILEKSAKEYAITALLLIMHRHSRDWYATFMGILCDDDYHYDLATVIDEEFCTKRKKSEAGNDANDGPPEEVTGQGSRSSSSGREGGEGVPPPGLELGDRTSASAEDVGDGHGSGSTVTPSGDAVFTAGEASPCRCGCCTQVLAKVTSLQAEVVELKALVSALVGRLQDRD